MCVDYMDLNKAYPKDAYPLPNIDRLVDGVADNKVLNFLDAYSRYNQIPMATTDMTKTAFITDDTNYFYKVMPFGLKNAGATYQWLMDKVFNHIMGNVSKYTSTSWSSNPRAITNMLRTYPQCFLHYDNTTSVLNFEKCVFGVDHGKFLGFMLTQRGIEANPEKCKAIIEM